MRLHDACLFGYAFNVSKYADSVSCINLLGTVFQIDDEFEITQSTKKFQKNGKFDNKQRQCLISGQQASYGPPNSSNVIWAGNARFNW